MSLPMLALVWPIPRRVLTAAEKTVLLRLADFADEQGGSCYPSQTRIAHETCLSLRATRNALHRLDERGFIRTAEPQQGRWTAEYQLNVDKLSRAAEPYRAAPRAAQRPAQQERRAAPRAAQADDWAANGDAVGRQILHRRAAPRAADPSVDPSEEKKPAAPVYATTTDANPEPAELAATAELQAPAPASPAVPLALNTDELRPAPELGRTVEVDPAPVKATAEPAARPVLVRPTGPVADAAAPAFKVVAAIASRALDLSLRRDKTDAFANVKEITKELLAEQRYPYDSELVGRAVEAALRDRDSASAAFSEQCRVLARGSAGLTRLVAQKPARAVELAPELVAAGGRR